MELSKRNEFQMGNLTDGVWLDLRESLGQRSHRDWISVMTQPKTDDT